MKNKAEWITVYNNFFKTLVKTDSKAPNEAIEAWLVETMTSARKPYYNSGEPIMDDPTYDRFEEHLKMLNPTHEFLTKVGANAEEKPEISASETEAEHLA